jgi:hypothetical protein
MSILLGPLAVLLTWAQWRWRAVNARAHALTAQMLRASIRIGARA